MEKKDIKKLHKAMVEQVKESLKGEHQIKSSRIPKVDFERDGKKCRVCAHNLTGTSTKYVVFEYLSTIGTDFKEPIDELVFAIPGEKQFYTINKLKMYDVVNANLQRPNKNFKITSTGDVLKNAGLCVSIEYNTFKQIEGMKINNFK